MGGFDPQYRCYRDYLCSLAFSDRLSLLSHPSCHAYYRSFESLQFVCLCLRPPLLMAFPASRLTLLDLWTTFDASAIDMSTYSRFSYLNQEQCLPQVCAPREREGGKVEEYNLHKFLEEAGFKSGSC